MRLAWAAHGCQNAVVVVDHASRRNNRLVPRFVDEKLSTMVLKGLQIRIIRIHQRAHSFVRQARIAIHIESAEIPIRISENDALEEAGADAQRLGTSHHESPAQLAARIEAGINWL